MKTSNCKKCKELIKNGVYYKWPVGEYKCPKCGGSFELGKEPIEIPPEVSEKLGKKNTCELLGEFGGVVGSPDEKVIIGDDNYFSDNEFLSNRLNPITLPQETLKFDLGRKDDKGKNRIDLVPPEAIEAIGEILTFGAEKYSPNNWQKVDDFNNRYYAAALRHLMAWKRGGKIDPESGKSHLKHTICNLAFLVWKEEQ